MEMHIYQLVYNVVVIVLPFHGYLRWEERYVKILYDGCHGTNEGQIRWNSWYLNPLSSWNEPLKFFYHFT